MPFSCFKVIIFNHLSDTTWECLSSHRPLFHWAGTGSKPEPVPDWAPVLTVGLEPVGSLQNRSQAQDNCPVVAEPYQKEWQHYCQEQRPLSFLHTHIRHTWAHMHVKARHRRSLMTVCVWLWLTQRLNPWLCLAETRRHHNVLFLGTSRPSIWAEPFQTHTCKQHLTRADRNGTDRAGGKWASAHWCPHTAHVTTRTTANTMRHRPFINYSRGGCRIFKEIKMHGGLKIKLWHGDTCYIHPTNVRGF